MNTIGLDIGGANLKAVFIPGEEDGGEDATPNRAIEVAFPMWQRHNQLADELERLLGEVSGSQQADRIAVTMTGELADCFASKREGVAFIANAAQQAAQECEVAFYMTDGSWCDAESCDSNWQRVAAANWHATAHFGARLLPNRTGLMIDVGSTTTDIIPIINGRPTTKGLTDLTRLTHGELIYAGIGRTPVCSLIQEVTLPSGRLSLAREFFATIGDAMIWNRLTPETSECDGTADGHPRTRGDAGRRLARMACSDPNEAESIIDQIAAATIKRFESLVASAIEAQLEIHRECSATFLIAGAGEVILKRVSRDKFPQSRCIQLSSLAGREGSVCGPAFAVASLRQAHG